MSEPSRVVTPTPAGPGPGWTRPALIVLAGLLALSSVLRMSSDDDWMRTYTAFLWPVITPLIIVVMSRRHAPVAGPSPWTPALLRVLAVIAGLAGGILLFAAGQASSTEDDPVAAVLAITLAALLLLGIVIAAVVLVSAAARGVSQRARVLPGLSAADRRRARDTAAGPVGLYCAGVLLAPWLPSSPLIWAPVAVAFAVGLPLWAWWVTRLASTRH